MDAGPSFPSSCFHVFCHSKRKKLSAGVSPLTIAAFSVLVCIITDPELLVALLLLPILVGIVALLADQSSTSHRREPMIWALCSTLLVLLVANMSDVEPPIIAVL